MMIKGISKQEKNELQKKYVGRRVRLLQMDDPQAPPAGTLGAVIGVDDAGTLLVKWDTGSSLKLILSHDKFEITGIFLITVVKDKYYSECGVEIAGIFSSYERACIAKEKLQEFLEEEEYDDAEVMISEPVLDKLSWYQMDQMIML